jgi:putative DNA primase/helicase
MPSLALLFYLADGGSENRIPLQYARMAATWCEYLESHAIRVYSCIVTPQLRAARELADKIQKRKVVTDGYFRCRDIYPKGGAAWTRPKP